MCGLDVCPFKPYVVSLLEHMGVALHLPAFSSLSPQGLRSFHGCQGLHPYVIEPILPFLQFWYIGSLFLYMYFGCEFPQKIVGHLSCGSVRPGVMHELGNWEKSWPVVLMDVSI